MRHGMAVVLLALFVAPVMAYGQEASGQTSAGEAPAGESREGELQAQIQTLLATIASLQEQVRRDEGGEVNSCWELLKEKLDILEPTTEYRLRKGDTFSGIWYAHKPGLSRYTEGCEEGGFLYAAAELNNRECDEKWFRSLRAGETVRIPAPMDREAQNHWQNSHILASGFEMMHDKLQQCEMRQGAVGSLPEERSPVMASFSGAPDEKDRVDILLVLCAAMTLLIGSVLALR